MFSGGNQLRLSATFGGTEFLEIALDTVSMMKKILLLPELLQVLWQ